MTGLNPLSSLNQTGLPAGMGATPIAYDSTRRRSRVIKSDWDSYFNELTSQLEQEERFYDEYKYREGVRNQLYYEGQFFWRFSEDTGTVRDLPHSDVDPFHPHNWFRYFADLSIAAALEASPDIIIDPVREDDHNVRSARTAKKLADYLEQELLTPEFRLESEKTRQLFGGVWWNSYWSLDAGNLYASRPMFQESLKQIGQNAFICGCGETGSADRLFNTIHGTTCPNCLRRDQLSVVSSPQHAINQITDYERVPVGFPVLECVTPLQMKGDRRGHYMNGQYLRRKRLIDKDVVAAAIPWWDADRATGAGVDDYGIRAEEQARRPYGAGTALTAMGMYGRDRQDVVVEEWWFQPSKYAHVEFNTDQVFIGGEELKVPARTRIGEVFPNGLFKLKIGNDWIDHREENFRKHWVYSPYIYVPNKSDGDSLKDMCEPQREIIKVRSLLYLYLLSRSGGAPTIIKAPLSETDYDGSPTSITRLSAGAPDPKELFFQPQFPPADPNLTSYANQMTGEMQIMSQTVSPTTTGDPNAQEMGGTNTARGMMIMNSKAQGLQGPKLMPLAFAQAQAVTQWIDLFRENVKDDVPIPIKGKTGTAEWFMINGSDLDTEYAVYPRAGSWMPRPKEERQAALQNAFTIFGALLLDPNTSQDLKKEIKEAYGIEADFDQYDLETRDAMLRIDQMKKMMPQATQLAEFLVMQDVIPPDETGNTPDPAQIAGDLLARMFPPDPDLDTPDVYMKYYWTWLKGDDGREADPILKIAVKAQWTMYRDIIQQAQEEQMQQQMEMQQGMDQSRDQAEMGKEQQRHQNKMQEKGADHEAGKQNKMIDADNRQKEAIAKAALQAATQKMPLPVHGKEMIPGLPGGVPPQPAM